MRGSMRSAGVCIVIASMIALAFNACIHVARGDGSTGMSVILKVGVLDKIKTLNPLPAIAFDVWTKDVFDIVYDTVGRVEAQTERLLPYILKGVDTDDDGVFRTDEYGVFAKMPATDPLRVVAYYDFNGVYFHDGVQVEIGDLFFSYQLRAMNPLMNNDVRVLMDKAGRSGSNYSVTRWLFMTPFTKTWVNEPTVGNASLRFAVKYELQEPFALFYRSTLADCVLFPRHVWEGEGYRMEGQVRIAPLHYDFGRAIYPESDSRFPQGIPMTDPQHFVYINTPTPAEDSAVEWQPTDSDVVGTGPFRFYRFYQITSETLLLRNSLYFVGNDSKTGEALDTFIPSYLHSPNIDGILFKVYSTQTLGLFALHSGEIDFCRWSFAPEFVPDLQNDPDITVWMTEDPSFAYLGYNMRRPSVGSYNWGQVDQFDVGLHFRRAVAHLTDKATIVTSFLQGYGVPGVVPVSPFNVMFYNASLTGYSFSQALAQAELDLAHQDAVYLSTHGGPAEASTWYTKDPVSGKIIMPGIGTSEFNLWCPNAEYDAFLANSCAFVAYEMQILGVNITPIYTAHNSILQLVIARDFDMYILFREVSTNDPDYLYDILHSSNSALGENFMGFNHPVSDHVLDESRKELNLSRRVSLVQWEQGVIAGELPVDTLYFRTRIEAERSVCFRGWIQDVGSIWNYWSLLNVSSSCPNFLPVAAFTVSPPTGSPMTVFTFDASACTDPEDPPGSLRVRWDFEDDGQWDTSWSTIKMVQHQYPSLGTYTARLEVMDTDFGINTTTAQVSVFNDTTPPTVSILSPTEGQLFNQTSIIVEGTAQDTGGSGLQKVEVRANGGNWLMAAGTSIWAAGVPLISGSNKVEARAFDNAGLQSAIDSVNISVNFLPTASFTISPDAGNTTTLFTFTSTSSDAEDPVTDLLFRWDWEGDSIWDTSWSNSTTAQHMFLHFGTYQIRLEVKDSGDQTNTTTTAQVVGLAPPVNLVAVTGEREGTVRLTWEHPTPEDVDRYIVRVYESRDAVLPFRTMNVTNTEVTVGDLEPGNIYWFDVHAMNDTAGQSDPTVRVSGLATTAPLDVFLVLIATLACIIVVFLIMLMLLVRRRKREEHHKEEDGGPESWER